MYVEIPIVFNMIKPMYEKVLYRHIIRQYSPAQSEWLFASDQ